MSQSNLSETQGAHQGGCACGRIRYELGAKPLFVHCCHCRWCQRETGAAFAINAMVETEYVQVEGDRPNEIETPSESGRGQIIVRCPDCQVALWSHYAGIGPKVAFLRVGTLDDPDKIPPDIHIYTDSKQPWLTLARDVPVVKEYYARKDYWPEESLARLKLLRER